MNYKKILLPLLLVAMIAVSISAISAADIATEPTITDNSVVLGEGDEPVTLTDQEKIQKIIDDTEVNGTAIIPEGEYKEINKIQINKTITLKAEGDVKIYGYSTMDETMVNMIELIGGDDLQINNVVISGITFISTRSDPTYNSTVGMKDYAIKSIKTNNLVVDNCMFLNTASGVDLNGAKNTVISNCYFNGAATKVNGVGGHSGKESGTKAISIMGSTTNTTVQNCKFDGWMLDCISMASNSQIANIYNNSFNGPAYAFFFGGGVARITIEGNEFYSSKESGKPTKELVSATKSSNGFVVVNNLFVLSEGVNALYTEAGNTAHGSGTVFGPFTFANNQIIATEGADLTKIVPVRFVSNGGDFAPQGTVNITNNSYPGVTNVVFWNKNWGTAPELGGIPMSSIVVGTIAATAEGDVVYNLEYRATTEITVEDISVAPNTGSIVATLTTNGKPLGEQQINIMINGVNIPVSTDENGIATVGVENFDIENGGKYQIVANYNGNSIYLNSIAMGTLVVKKATSITASAAVFNTKTNTYTATLKDENNKVVVNKAVKLIINGKTFSAMTNSKGVATFKVSGITTPKAYSATIKFEGDNTYLASSKVVKITVKKATSITANAIKVKAGKAGYLTVVLKDVDGKAVAKRTVKVSLNGKIYSLTTAANGAAKLKVSIAKKNTYKTIVKFAGDSTYFGSSKTTYVKVY